MQCRECSHDNPVGQKFRGECGAPLDLPAADKRRPLAASYTPPHLAERILTLRSTLEGERKLVTVMFCDIANSTPLAARIGAEAMHRLLDAFFQLALAEVHRYEGTINQFLGDASWRCSARRWRTRTMRVARCLQHSAPASACGAPQSTLR
jgi:class 3 adenylate cyclase